MSRKSKTLIIILGVLVLLGGGYYGSAIWKKKKPASTSSAATAPKIGNLDSSKLVKIEVPGIVLQKNNDTWELVSLEGKNPPKGIELDQSQIQNMTYSLATVYVEQVVEETPADLSVYGLDKPSSRAVVTDSDGKRVEYILGDVAPSRTSNYIMEGGDPTVYTVSSYSADSMRFTLDKIRQRALFAAFELPTLTQFRLESPAARIEISAKPENVPPYLASSFTTFIMSSPYKLPRGVNSESFNTLLTPFNNLAIADFIDDLPSSLKPYGLDTPIRIFLQTNAASLDLQIGNQVDGKRYAKLAGAPGVFTLSGLESVISAKPFDLVDKFPLLVSIDSVNHLSVTGGEKDLNADFQGTGDDAVYTLNGKKTESKSFKIFYQAVIGLLMDAEYSGGNVPAQNSEAPGTGNITIEYQFNTPPGEQTSLTLIPYNRDFYVLRQQGTMEFLISRNQVRKIYETADTVTYE